MFDESHSRTGTSVILTLPLIGWTPKDRGRNRGLSVVKCGAQQRTDQWWPDCGNGIKPNVKTKITGNDPHDTSQEITPAFVREWMRYLIARYGSAANGGIPFASTSVHREVRRGCPGHETFQESVVLTGRNSAEFAAAALVQSPGLFTVIPVIPAKATTIGPWADQVSSTPHVDSSRTLFLCRSGFVHIRVPE